MEQLKSFSQYILQIGYKYGLHSVFDDFLEMVICSLSLGAKEDRYHEIVRNFEKPDAYLMAEAFGALVIEMDNKGEGLKDGFGDFYMEYLSHGLNGQFFTPEPICDMMARILNRQVLANGWLIVVVDQGECSWQQQKSAEIPCFSEPILTGPVR